MMHPVALRRPGAKAPKVRGKARPGRDILWVLALKIVMLAALSQLFFSPSQRPPIDDAGVSRHLFDGRAFDAGKAEE
jgi:hypothetical protein